MAKGFVVPMAAHAVVYAESQLLDAKMNTLQKVPGIAAALGYAGLLPFVFLSVALWFVDEATAVPISDALLLYAAVILAFMGAIHWGVAMMQPDGPNRLQLGLSVVPPLVAWFASFTPWVINYSVLYLAFAGLCVFDSRLSKRGVLPGWYPKLRVPLTVVVVASLISAQLALTLGQ